MKKQVLFLFLGFIATLTSCISEDMEITKAGSKLSVRDTIPEFQVITLDQDTFTQDNHKGKTLVLLFFHTECGDCQKELPIVEQVYRDCRQDSLWQLVCIGRAEKTDAVRQYWQKNQFTMPVSPQEDRTIYDRFAYSGVPMLYVIDAQNVIQAIYDDQNMASYEELKGWISKVNEENQKEKEQASYSRVYSLTSPR